MGFKPFLLGSCSKIEKLLTIPKINFKCFSTCMASVDCLALSVIASFIPLAKYYNHKSRVKEEEADWFQDDVEGFMQQIDSSYFKILEKRQKKQKQHRSPNVHSKRNQSKASTLDFNFAAKVQSLKALTLTLHASNSREDVDSICAVDECILYFIRGKLKGMPSRIHLQMIVFGYTPHQKRINTLSQTIEDRMECIRSLDKRKGVEIGRDILSASKLNKLRKRQNTYSLQHGDKSGKIKNSGFVDSRNLQWTPPMTMDTLFYRLSLSGDRTKHRLSYESSFDEIAMFYCKSKEELFNDAMDIIRDKIKVKPKNDWYQTPYHGHPVYIAMHATATCCRICLGQWFNIAEKGQLSLSQMKYIASVLVKWLELNCPPQFS